MTKKVVSIAAAVAIAAAVVVIKTQSSQTPSEPKALVSSPPLIGTGTLEAKNVVIIAPKTTARILSLHADEGDSVRAGQVLAQMEPSEIEAALNESRAGIEKSRAQHSAQNALIGDLQARYELSDANLKRYASLHKEGFVTQAEYDSAVAAQKSAASQLQSAKQTLALYERDIQKAQASSAVQQAKFDDLTLRSPIDGVILSRNAEAGSTIGAGSAVFRVADPESAWVKVYIDEAQIHKIALGGKAQVSLRTHPGKLFDAGVVRIGVESDRVTEERVVYLGLKHSPEAFHLGDQAEAKFLP
jgi:HlyD family secretion protein